jgi:hypothetical protein
MILPRFSSVSDDLLCFNLIQWNPAPAQAMNQALPDDSSESNNYSPVPYGELDALRFKAELEVAQRELEDVSKKAGIAELEWEDRRKQLLNSCWQPSMVYPLDYPPIQFGFDTNHHCLALRSPRR